MTARKVCDHNREITILKSGFIGKKDLEVEFRDKKSFSFVSKHWKGFRGYADSGNIKILVQFSGNSNLKFSSNF